ncbi:ABC transporter permease [Sulfolobus sp. E3]|nr:ABC transporter permease [Sulfolobus sp. E3]
MNPIFRSKYFIISLAFLVILVGPIVIGYFTIPKANPYTPAGQEAAAPYAVPSWANAFYGNLPPDIMVPSSYSLIAAKSPSVITYWNLRNMSINGDQVEVLWVSNFGPTGESFEKTMSTFGNTGNGSIEVIIKGDNPVNITLYHTFYYNYLLPSSLDSFLMQASIYYESSGSQFLFNGYIVNSKNETYWMLTSGNYIIPTLATVEKYISPKTWIYVLATSGDASLTPWYYTANLPPSEQAFANSIFLHSVFNLTGTYTVQYQISYIPSGKNSSIIIYLSDLLFKFLGSRYGLLGTDDNGASVFAEYVQGGAFDLILALIVGAVIVGVGAITGLLAGYYSGKTDQVLISISDFILLLPGLALLIVLITIFQQIFISSSKVLLIAAVLVLLSWPPTARIIKGQTLSIRNMGFVEAAKVLGMSNFQILRKHVVRHVIPIIIAQLIFDIPAVIGIESGLDFLGIGIITFPTWGNMLGFSAHAATSAPYFAWWWILPPGIALFLLGISLYYIGEAITRFYGLTSGESR